MATSQQSRTEEMIVQSRPRQLVPQLLLIACIFELFYLLIVALSPLRELHLSNSPLAAGASWTLVPFSLLSSVLRPWTGSLLDSTEFASLLLGITFLGILAVYLPAIVLIVRERPEATRRWLYLLLGGALLFGITLLFQPKLFSDDVFTYIFSGRILTIYGADPLNTAPVRYPADPYLAWVLSGRNTPNIYGPLWISVTALLAGISNVPVFSLLLFKGFALLTHLSNCVLIWGILNEIAPSRRVLGTLLYAWNPLAVIELAGSGHNEGFLLVLLLLATWLYIRAVRTSRRWLFLCMLGVFGLAISTNLLSLLLAPLYLWFHLRKERSVTRAAWSFCACLLLMLVPEALISLPFWRGASTFFAVTSAVDIEHFVHSPVGTLAIPIRAVFQFVATAGHFPAFLQPISAADVALRASALFIFVLIYTHLFGRVRHAPGSVALALQKRRTEAIDVEMRLPAFDVLFYSCGVAVFWYLILVSGWFWPWYLLWTLWPVALRRLDGFTVAILILSGTALFLYSFIGFTRGPIATYQAALIFGIPLIFLIVARIRGQKGPVVSHERRGETT
ncbi:MAG: hypothetical protein JO011_13375 [Ktedonobacteraceae bacterium]|nr:hypothetical protein [Ktedonobacteraceae bacterium]